MFLAVLLLWCGLAFYVYKNNQTVLKTLIQQLNKHVNGDIQVGSLEPTLLKGFPGVSVTLQELRLRDSLWQQHHHDLLHARHIHVTLDVLSLLRGQVDIRKIALQNAEIYVYTDSTGYSNSHILRTGGASEAKDEKDGHGVLAIRKMAFDQVNLIVDNRQRAKRFDFEINALDGKIDYPDSGWNGSFKLKTLIKSFAFNTHKGSFLKDKALEGTLTAHYDRKSEAIRIDQNKLKIGDDDFQVGAAIQLTRHVPAFSVSIQADAVAYQRLSRLLAPNISSKLLEFSIEKPIAVTGTITDDGKKTSADPLIEVRMIVKDNTVGFPSGELSQCSFTGTFTNQQDPKKGISDENSLIRFYNLTGNFYNAPLKIDTFSIKNLSHPLAEGFVTSSFNLNRLNRNIGEDTFTFNDGQADLRLFCRMDIDNFRFTKPVLSGNIIVKNADITYLPRNMRFVKSNLTLFFNQKDLSLSNSRFQLGKSILYVDGDIRNFLNFYYTDPAKIVANIRLRSPMLSLGEFMSFLGPRKTQKKKTPRHGNETPVADQLATVLEMSQVNLALQVDKATYKRFVANKLTAAVAMTDAGIAFNDININHAGGSLKMKGNIRPSGKRNVFRMQASVHRVNVKEFFHAFDNFGQSTVTNQNLNGLISAEIDASGSMTDAGVLLAHSMFGQVRFNLQQAALIGFEPLQKVQKLAFRNRDFNHIALNDLQGTLSLAGDKVQISPLQINTSVLNFNIKGVYGFNNGTDIAMDIPLRNPKKDEGISDPEERALARMRGIVLHLKAVDDGKGGVKIRWNSAHD